jgi:hypothetical protein
MFALKGRGINFKSEPFITLEPGVGADFIGLLFPTRYAVHYARMLAGPTQLPPIGAGRSVIGGILARFHFPRIGFLSAGAEAGATVTGRSWSGRAVGGNARMPARRSLFRNLRVDECPVAFVRDRVQAVITKKMPAQAASFRPELGFRLAGRFEAPIRVAVGAEFHATLPGFLWTFSIGEGCWRYRLQDRENFRLQRTDPLMQFKRNAPPGQLTIGAGGQLPTGFFD